MISLFTGAPGAGKTASLVALLLDYAKDRPVYVYGLDGYSGPHFPLSDPTDWMGLVPDGAIVVIDEVQQVWRPRGPGTKVPPHIAALEIHRHRGIDFFITTQGPNLLDANVRALVGRHVHMRDLGVLGRWWYEWPECADNCRTGFRSAPVKKRFRLPRKAFALYKSASLHTRAPRSFPTALVVAVVALAGTGVLAYRSYSSIIGKIRGGGPEVAGVSLPSSSPSLPSQSAVLAEVLPSPALPASAPAPLPSSALPPAPVFAGCAVAKKVCQCYDTSGRVLPPDLNACKASVLGAGVTLGSAPVSPYGRPLSSSCLSCSVGFDCRLCASWPSPSVSLTCRCLAAGRVPLPCLFLINIGARVLWGTDAACGMWRSPWMRPVRFPLCFIRVCGCAGAWGPRRSGVAGRRGARRANLLLGQFSTVGVEWRKNPGNSVNCSGVDQQN